jgi:hypothetical protein
MTKAVGMLAIVIICILMFPVAIGIIGGFFGIIVGVLGAVFGAIFGIIGGLFGAVFGVIGWLFEGIFGWGWDGPFHTTDCNVVVWAVAFLVVALLVRNRRG